MSLLLSLVGEQPIPILLTDRALRPAVHVLAYTDRTHRVARHLAGLLPHATLLPIPHAYDIARVHGVLAQAYRSGMVFNLTGGTKPMAWAGYEVARQARAPFVYVQSEGHHTVLYRYALDQNRPALVERRLLPTLITLEDYLRAHGLTPRAEGQAANDHERVLAAFFRPRVDEMRMGLIFPAFEVDFLLRRGNRVAVVEAKERRSKHKRRFGLDQLTTIAGREHLGTYTGKIWIVARPLGKPLQDLAQAYRVHVVVVGRDTAGRLNASSQRALEAALDAVLGPLSAP